jgi:6-pyruvoyltetrahydropterin/6-carboxytetrahydropterin synthase
MYTVKKRMEIAGAHRLNLPYPSKCAAVHGHNWIVTVWCKAEALNEAGMVVDFTHIKAAVDALDHAYINDMMDRSGQNPTAENIAGMICERLQPFCFKVSVQESEGNEAVYEK